MTISSRPRLLSSVAVALATLATLASTSPAVAAHDTPVSAGANVHHGSDAINATAEWSANAFAQSWMRHAAERDWKWIGKHSKMATGPLSSAVRVSDIKWWLKGGAVSQLARCDDGYDDDATTKECWTADAATIMVKRKSSGRLLVTGFWIQD